jgi:DNA phosphorothioation-dependent restriction protein DptG
MVLNDKAKDALEEQNQALQNELQALRKSKAETEAKNKELRVAHLRQENRIDQLRKDINELTSDNEILCDGHNEVTRTNGTLRSNIAALNTNLDQWEKYALGERDQLTKFIAYTEELEKRLQKSEALNRDLEEHNEDLEDRLITEKIASQAFEAECQELERKNKALWTTVKYLDGLVDEDQSEVMRMRTGVLKLKTLWEAGEPD